VNGIASPDDKAERLLSVTAVGAGHLLKELAYDDGEPLTASRLDGRLHTATRHNWVNLPWDGTGADVDVEVTETYAYDGVGGRVSDRTTDLVRPSPYGTSTFSQAFTWTPLGDPDVMDYPTCTGVACPSGKTEFQVDHGYEAGYLTSIVSPTGQNWIEQIRYHPNGLWSEIDHRNNWTDRQTIASHGMQRPLEITAENGAGQVQHTTGSFAYDGAGNVKAMGADSFHYDAHNRLAGGTIDGQGYSYTYDAYGNLTSHTRAGTTVSICIDSKKNRMEEPGSSCPYLEAHQSYFGNIETLQTTNYVYDALDMPIHRNPEPVPPDHTYVYTADEERLWFINAGGGPPPGDGGSGTAWEGLFLRDLDGKLLRQYSKETTTPFTPPDSVYTAPFTVSRDSIHRNGQLAVVRLPGGVIRHQHLDHLGTPRAISAGNGALVSTHKYTPYGKELGGSSGNALQFTGHERDSHGVGEDDNLDYMHARFYSHYVGRFLSVDAENRYATTASPQVWNRYTYGLNNPVKFVDPDGKVPIIPMVIAAGAAMFFTPDVANAPADPEDIQASDRTGERILAGSIGELGGAYAGRALGALGRSLGGVVGRILGSQAASSVRFASRELLESHFLKHGAEFGARTAKEYLEQAQEFVARDGLESAVKAGGDKLLYDPLTNEFAIVTEKGVLRTYFKPEKNLEYWIRQLDKIEKRGPV
jgi:RHS repeat-associated protein